MKLKNKTMKTVRHCGIVVSDMEKSLEFYRDILGLKIKVDALEEGEFIDAILGMQKVKVRTVKMLADEGDALVELLFYHSRPEGSSHTAFTVENLDDEYKRLKEKGIKFINSPQVSPNGKAKVAFCYDPDGIPVELVEQII